MPNLVWSFCRFLYFISTKGELNFLSERSEVENNWVVFIVDTIYLQIHMLDRIQSHQISRGNL